MFFKKRERPPSSPSWMKWLLALFVLYALATYQRPGTPEEPNTLRETIRNIKNEANQIDLSQYTEKMFPQYVAMLRISDVEVGTGLPVVCGQEAVIAYETFLPDGKAFDDKASKEKPLRFVIGEHKVMPVLEEGVIGMQKGGRRSLLAPPKLAYGAEKFVRKDVPEQDFIRFEVTLLELSPPLPDPNKTSYRITTTRPGTGRAIVCGNDIKLHAEIWSASGKKLYSTKDEGAAPLVFTLGASQVFLGLEQGAVGMQPGEIRTLVVPPTFQQALRKAKPDIEIPLPANETVIVDVEAVP